MAFEFDPEKSRLNKEKHGIDFVEAQALWLGDTVTVDGKVVGDEERQIVLGKIGGKVWAAVIARRGENVRIISCRRARPGEEKLYGNKA